jgi:hypothetical protein
MNNPIRKPLLSAGIVCLGLLLGAASLPGTTLAQPERADRRAFDGPATISVSFGGGSVKSFVAALRKASGDVPVNIVVSGDIEGLDLPEIELEQVTVANAVRSLEFLRLPDHRIGVEALDESMPFGVLAIKAWRSDGASAFRESVQVQMTAGQIERQVTIFSLAELLESDVDDDSATADVSTLLAAVDAALAMADAQGAEIKFHPDSSLLIVRGTGRQLSLVKELITAMNSDILRRRGEMLELKNELKSARTLAHRANIELRTAYAEVEIAKAEFEQLQQLQKDGFTSEGDVRKADLKLQQMMGRIEVSQLELDQATSRVDEISYRIKHLSARQSAPTTEDAVKAEISRLEQRISVLKARLTEISGDANRRR